MGPWDLVTPWVSPSRILKAGVIIPVMSRVVTKSHALPSRVEGAYGVGFIVGTQGSHFSDPRGGPPALRFGEGLRPKPLWFRLFW